MRKLRTCIGILIVLQYMYSGNSLSVKVLSFLTLLGVA
jgi:hypothetical protein